MLIVSATALSASNTDMTAGALLDDQYSAMSLIPSGNFHSARRPIISANLA